MKFFQKIAVIALLLLTSCGIFNSGDSTRLKVKSASAQSWVVKGEERKGILVNVELTGNIENVKVLALVYLKEQLKPIVQVKDGILNISADFEKGVKTVFPRPTITDKENMVIYSYKGKIYNQKLDNIEHKPAKYYTNKQ